MVAKGSNEVNCGSLQLDQLSVLIKDEPGALRSFTSPVVKTKPVGIPKSVEAPFVKVPYALLGHEIVALLVFKPKPIIALTIS